MPADEYENENPGQHATAAYLMFLMNFYF